MSEEGPTQRLTQRTVASSPKVRNACLKILSGPNSGQLIRINSDSFQIGRGPDNQLVIKDAQVSRQHARIDRTGDSHVMLTDLGSTNGTVVEGEAVTSRVLREGDQIALGDSVILRLSYVDELEENLERQLFTKANFDELMAVVGRPAFIERLHGELYATGRMSVALIGIDRFRHINQELGHAAGDAVLRELVARIRAVLRTRDAIGRYTGEEFGLVLPEMTIDNARAVMERVRLAVARRAFNVPEPLDVTVSVGIAQSDLHGNDAESLLSHATRCLEQARRDGANQVVTQVQAEAPAPPPAPPARKPQRRSSTRVNCSFAVTCRDGQRKFNARVVDIGIQGLRLLLPERVAVGAQLGLAPEAPGMTEVTGHVLWCRKRRNQEILEAGIVYAEPQEQLPSSWVHLALKRLGFGVIPFSERRRSVRADSGLPVKLWEGTHCSPVLLLNICPEGAAIEGTDPLALGFPVRLEVPQTGLQLNGEVVYTRPVAENRHRTGLAFTEPLAPEQLRPLEAPDQ